MDDMRWHSEHALVEGEIAQFLIGSRTASSALLAWFLHDRLVNIIQAPLNHIGKSLVMTHPMDALNLDMQVSLIGGAILASPFIFYQVWLFIAPGLYQ